MSIDQLRESGTLELYVIGDLSESEIIAVESAIEAHPELKQDIHEIELSLEQYALANAVPPKATLKPMVLAVVNYTSRLQAGEPQLDPPALTPDSKIEDFSQWLHRSDLQEPSSYDSMTAHIIGASEEKTTLIVWLKEGAPAEVHTDEYETFLILEGTCDITIGDEVHSLKPNDVLTIPLHISHQVVVTSDTRCKVILERKAA